MSEADAPASPEGKSSDAWEANFAWGLYYSKLATDASEATAGSWAMDHVGSAAAAPHRMLQAEALLSASEAAPASRQREKTAERALRLYYHAKWLAERNYAAAAEWRYREASRLARGCRRNVLAAHALSRLGYFLMHWKRDDEARLVLQESEKVSTKSNPLAPYLFGVLERKAAGANVDRLRAAEERILNSSKQPSEELEAERVQLIREIRFWRGAETSPRHCLAAKDAAQMVVCLSSHIIGAFLR